MSSHERLSGKDVWLLDSGASCHLTGNLNLLSNVHEASSIHLELPNGETTLATKKGLVHLNSQIVLKDVLYVPQFCCNLISIAQLIDDSFCSVTFIKKLCVIQDLTTRSLIGVGEPRRRGLLLSRQVYKNGSGQQSVFLSRFGINS